MCLNCVSDNGDNLWAVCIYANKQPLIDEKKGGLAVSKYTRKHTHIHTHLYALAYHSQYEIWCALWHYTHTHSLIHIDIYTQSHRRRDTHSTT